MVQYGPKYKKGQNSPKQSWVNNLKFEYIQIFWKNMFICKNIIWFFLGHIYSDLYSWSFYHAEYISIIICRISMVSVSVSVSQGATWCSIRGAPSPPTPLIVLLVCPCVTVTVTVTVIVAVTVAVIFCSCLMFALNCWKSSVFGGKYSGTGWPAKVYPH